MREPQTPLLALLFGAALVTSCGGSGTGTSTQSTGAGGGEPTGSSSSATGTGGNGGAGGTAASTTGTGGSIGTGGAGGAGSTGTATGGATGSGGSGGGGTTSSGSGGAAGGGPVCTPMSTQPCYSGPAATMGVGACKAGVQTCAADGSGFGPCVGEVVPAAETCATPEDDDCDGMVNEEGAGCVCVPGSTMPCYSGPAGTENIGVCKGGMAACNALGTDYGPCTGEVLPSPETCNTPDDDDCDGMTNEDGAGCVCVPGATQSCYSGPAGTAGVGACKAGTRTCNALGTAYGACTGEVLPALESCQTAVDDDCDGMVNEGCAALTCNLYTENFDDGNAGEVTAGPYLIDWCDTYIPTTQNTPLCMTGRTLRTNDSTIDPTIWIHKGTASCTQVRITYRYYQFALSNVNVTYQQSNDAAPVCEKTGAFTSLASHVPLQACTQQSVTIPFGNAAGVYVRFEHGTGTNALWIDDLGVELLGCDC